MAERPPATDLRGGNASEDSLTRSMANLVAAYAVESKPDFLSGAAPEITVRTGDSWRLIWSLAGTIRICSEVVSGSVLCEQVYLDSPGGRGMIKRFAYRSVPDYGGPRDRALAKSRYRSEDLELIPWDVAVRLHLGLRRDRSRARSLLCFGFDDEFLVGGGNLVTSCRR